MIVTKTPLRTSFFGGGTDFKDYYQKSKYGYGTVVSIALDMYVYIIINKRFDDKIRIVYSGNELVDNVDDIKHNIIREALKMTNITKGVEILYLANLPMTNLGIGLASSSALAVGVLSALHEFKGETVSKETLAKEAIDLEINHLHQQIGIQDQYAVSFGGFNKYEFNKDDSVTIKKINIDYDIKNDLFSKILLFYTGLTRDSSKIFEKQKETTINKSEILDEMVDIADKSYELLNNKEYDEFGKLLNRAWNVKKKFADNISNNLIDEMYSKALDAGAMGGKILGAGGGGFLLLYVPFDKQNNVRNSLKDFKEVKFSFDEIGSQIVYKD